MIVDRRQVLITGAAAFAALALAPTTALANRLTFKLRGVAIRGYDPVAYFKVGKPQKGNKQFQTKWNGATWYFASQENLDDFNSSPEKFAPQYGGYCSWAVANGYTASTIPEAWDIKNGKLYLNYDLSIRKRWRTNVSGHIKQGDRNWPKLRKSLV